MIPVMPPHVRVDVEQASAVREGAFKRCICHERVFAEKIRSRGHARVTPVCVFMCMRRLLGRLNFFLHRAQVCLRGSAPQVLSVSSSSSSSEKLELVGDEWVIVNGVDEWGEWEGVR